MRAIFLFLFLLLASTGQASELPVQWRVAGFFARSDEWIMRCKTAVADQLYVLKVGEFRELRFSDQDNNCLHLLAAELRLTIYDRGPQVAGDRRLDVTAQRVAYDPRTQRSDTGAVPMPHYKLKYAWGQAEHFGRVLSEDHIQLSCRQYVQTVFGQVNPVGPRTLDCRAIEGSSIEFHILLTDSSLWLR